MSTRSTTRISPRTRRPRRRARASSSYLDEYVLARQGRAPCRRDRAADRRRAPRRRSAPRRRFRPLPASFCARKAGRSASRAFTSARAIRSPRARASSSTSPGRAASTTSSSAARRSTARRTSTWCAPKAGAFRARSAPPSCTSPAARSSSAKSIRARAGAARSSSSPRPAGAAEVCPRRPCAAHRQGAFLAGRRSGAASGWKASIPGIRRARCARRPASTTTRRRAETAAPPAAEELELLRGRWRSADCGRLPRFRQGGYWS